MRRLWMIAFVAASCASLAACSDDNSGNTGSNAGPPDASARQLPPMGPPAADASFDAPPSPPEHDVRDPNLQPEDPGCCPVDFALAPRHPDQVQKVVLRGSAAPLIRVDGYELDEDNGVWSTQVCMPPDYQGTYHYEVSLPSTGDEPFVAIMYNPYVTTTERDGDVVNEWTPAADCDSLDAAVHSKTSD